MNFEIFDVSISGYMIYFVFGAILLSFTLALIRVIKGPTAPDRVVGLDTINTIVIASMILLGAIFQQIILIDVAIVYAFLSFISTLFIAKLLKGGGI